MTGRITSILACALLSSTALASPAMAAQDNDMDDTTGGEAALPQSRQSLDEIVVTARKREESLRDVPVAVTAISATQLQNNLASDLNKVSELAPQVMIGRVSSGTGAFFTIRGISSLATDSGLDQSVAVSVDGVTMSRGRIVGSAVFDVQQVEILKGPQALFFGKNSPAGVLSIKSADPEDYFEGYVKAGYEFEAKERYFEGAVSLPISDNLKTRLAMRGSWMDGWIKNAAEPVASPFDPGVTMPGAVNGSRMPDTRDLAARATVVWEPTDDFSAKLKVLLNEQEQNSGAGFAEPYCMGGTKVPTTGGVTIPFADCKKNQVTAVSGLPPEFAVNYPYGNGGVPYLDSNFTFASLTLDKSLGDLDLVSTSGYYKQSLSDAFNGDHTSFTRIYTSEHEKYELLTQEVRLNSDFDTPVNFMVGAYFEHSTRDWSNQPNLFNAYDPVADTYVSNRQVSDSTTNAYSVFGQVRWDILPTLELSGGVRYSRDEKKSAFVNTYNNPNSGVAAGLYPEGQVLRISFKDENLSPEATLTWHPTPNQTLYGAYKTGYKAGGISNSALLPATATAATQTFQSEKAEGFEIGYKADLFNDQLRVDLTGYTYKFKDLQVSFFDSTQFRFLVGNAAAVRTKGVEGSFRWLATDALSLRGSIGYNDATYLNFEGAQCYAGQTVAQGCIGNVQDLSGTTPARAPELTYNLGADYLAEIGSNWLANLTVDAAYTSSYQSADDRAPGGLQESFWRLNAAVHIYPDDERFRFSLIGRNLTNSYYLIRSSVQPGAGNPEQFLGFFNRPREVAIQAQYRF